MERPVVSAIQPVAPRPLPAVRRKLAEANGEPSPYADGIDPPEESDELARGVTEGVRAAVEFDRTQKKKAQKLLDAANLRALERLKSKDQRVRAHVAAHMRAAARYVRGPASHSYERGPDGRHYAVSGDVTFDVGAVPNSPQASLRKAAAIQAGALAPMDPSSSDLAAARAAAALADRIVETIATEAASAEHEHAGESHAEHDAHGPHAASPSPDAPSSGRALALEHDAALASEVAQTPPSSGVAVGGYRTAASPDASEPLAVL